MNSTMDLSFDALLGLWKNGLRTSSARADNFLSSWALNESPVREDFLSDLLALRFPARRLSDGEHGELVDAIEQTVQGNLPRSGRHRQAVWEEGWARNLSAVRAEENESALVPGYFEKSRFVRLGEHFFEVILPATEALLLGCLVDYVVEGLATNFGFDNVHEFGCGTGIHVSRLAKRCPKRQVHGYDWAISSVEIVEHLRRNAGQANLGGARFDFFQPNDQVEVSSDDIVLTVATLEQVGTDFRPFLDFLGKKSPRLVVNIEPIEELLDLESRVGRLSAEYFRKRNYLTGFYSHLIDLESLNKVEIIHSGRSGLGSLYIEGYSIVAWRFTGDRGVRLAK
jgi:hypothetical protein